MQNMHCPWLHECIIRSWIYLHRVPNQIWFKIKLDERYIRYSKREPCFLLNEWVLSSDGSKHRIVLGINPKLILRKSMKQKVDDICLWFDLDDSDTQSLIKEATSSNTTAQEIVIPAFDIHNKEFGSGTGDDRITTNVYELQISPD